MTIYGMCKKSSCLRDRGLRLLGVRDGRDVLRVLLLAQVRRRRQRLARIVKSAEHPQPKYGMFNRGRGRIFQPTHLPRQK